MKNKLHSLFVTPVYSSLRETEFTEEELAAVEFFAATNRPNHGNNISVDNHVLDHNNLIDLKEWLEENIRIYAKDVLCVSDEVDFYITTSWLNWTMPGQHHHEHKHPNSIVSGVFYIATGAEDKIMFAKTPEGSIRLPTTQWNTMNSFTWWLPAEQNTLYLFPSTLIHSVPKTTGQNVRVSLSFNTFVKGNLDIGDVVSNLSL